LVGASYDRLTSREETALDVQIKPLIRKAVKVVIVIVGTLFILQNLDFQITALLAGLSIGGLAFALAAQDTIKNLFGSILIFADKPFKVGDWISFNGFDGMVEEVGVRSTRVRTFYNSLIYIPNGRLSDMPVDNYGEREYRRFFTHISITYDTPPELIEAFVEGLKEIVNTHPKTRKDFYEVHMNEFGPSSLNIMFYIFFKVNSWSAELQARHEVIMSAIKLSRKLGVRFAFPTQTLHMEEFPGKGKTTPVYQTDKDAVDEKLKDFSAVLKTQKGI
jgi:MscS family membrane protein